MCGVATIVRTPARSAMAAISTDSARPRQARIPEPFPDGAFSSLPSWLPEIVTDRSRLVQLVPVGPAGETRRSLACDQMPAGSALKPYAVAVVTVAVGLLVWQFAGIV